MPKEHVLMSQGFCSVFGISIPSPVFLQELITGFWPDHDDIDHRRLALIRAIPSAEVTPQDWAFCEDITGSTGSWWTDETEPLPSFSQLKKLFDQRMNRVRIPSIRNSQLTTITSSISMRVSSV